MRRGRSAAVLVAVAGLALTGCTTSGAGADDGGTPGGGPLPQASTLPDDAEVPAFSGPWATEFERAYRASESDLQRKVLADGRITDQEMSALQDGFRDCLELQSFSEVTFTDDGGFGLSAPDGWDDARVQESVTACQASTLGQVDTLYFGMQRNPAHEDEWDLMAACLVRQGLVPAGYSAEDYGRDAPAGTFPFDSGDPLFNACVADPLTAGTA